MGAREGNLAANGCPRCRGFLQNLANKAFLPDDFPGGRGVGDLLGGWRRISNSRYGCETSTTVSRAILLSVRAIILSRKDWHSCANGAVVLAIPGPACAPGILPRRPNRRDGASVVAAIDAAPTEGIPMSKSRIAAQATPKDPNESSSNGLTRRRAQQAIVESAPQRHPTRTPHELIVSKRKSSRRCILRRAPPLTQLRRRPDGSAIRFVDSCQGWCARSSV